jgi:phosphatidylglycerol lysyltransferase
MPLGCWRVILLATGIIASLLKGGDYEEAVILAFLLAGLLPSRRQFYRRASLFGERFTAGWLATIALVLHLRRSGWVFSPTSIWSIRIRCGGPFSFSGEGEAPRFLRAMVGRAGSSAILWGCEVTATAAVFEPTLPTPDELAQARTMVAAFPHSYAHLALLGDKALLFNSRSQMRS